MITVVTGTPGSGKSFSVVHVTFTEYALKSSRPIATNLPINLDKFIELHNLGDAQAESLRKRVVFLKDRFSTAWGEKAYTVLPDGREIEREDDHAALYPNAEIKRVRYPLEREAQVVGKEREVVSPENQFHEIREFWRFGPPGCVYLIDEIGKYASALDRNKRSKELGTYLQQHRHYHDDIYFLCQNFSQADKQIRDNVERRYICKRSTSERMIKTRFFGTYMYPVLFFMLCEVTGDPMSTREFRNGEISRQWWVFPSKKKYACYNSYSKGDGLTGKDGEGQQGEDQLAAAKNRRDSWHKNQWRLYFLGASALVAFLVLRSYFSWALGDHTAVARSSSSVDSDPVELVQQVDQALTEGGSLSAPGIVPTPEPSGPSHVAIINPGLTHSDVEQLFEGAGYILGDKIIVRESHVELARLVEQNGRKERPHYGRFLIVRFRDWEGIDLQTIQKVRLRASNNGTRLDFSLEYEAQDIPSDYEILSMIDTVLVPGRKVTIANGKILREDQSTAADNGRVFTSGKIEEEIGLKFEFTPYTYPEKRIIRGEMLLDDTTGDTLDETTKSVIGSWAELTPDLRLVGSVTREYVRTDSDTVIPFTGWVPVVRKFRWKNDVRVRELLCVYGQHYPDEPSGSSLDPAVSGVARALGAGQVIHQRCKLPIEYAIRGDVFPDDVPQGMKSEPLELPLSE